MFFVLDNKENIVSFNDKIKVEINDNALSSCTDSHLSFFKIHHHMNLRSGLDKAWCYQVNNNNM